MASVFITGSSDGLGLVVAKLLVDEGHELAAAGAKRGAPQEVERSPAIASSAPGGAPSLRRHRSLTLPSCFTTRIRGGAMQGRRHRTDRA